MTLTHQGREYHLVTEQKTQAGEQPIFLFQSGTKQIVGTLKELQKLYVIDGEDNRPKKKAGEHYRLLYGTQVIFSNASYPLVKKKKDESINLPQFASGKLIIE